MKTAVVTGASKGIGKATAIALALEGYSVAINFKNDAKAARETLRACNRHSSGNFIVQADVSKEEDVTRMAKEIKHAFKAVNVLVNNAGIYDQGDSPTNLEAFENIYKNNFKSVVLVTKYMLPLMKKGKIVNVSSIHGRLGHGRPSSIAYAAFKAALENYTKNLAKKLAPSILVNAIAPGRVATPMWGNLTKKEQKKLGRIHLIKRMIQPEEIADGILFLIRNDAVCGEILTIDGGYGISTVAV